MLEQFKAFNITFTFVNGARIRTEKTKKKSAQRGCLETHCRIIKEAEEAQLPNVCILEDDIWIHQNYETFLDDLIFLPKDWGLIYLSWSHINTQTKYEHIRNNLFRVYKANDTSGYIINKRLYSLFDTIRKGPIPIDYALVEASLEHKMYCLLTPENIERIRAIPTRKKKRLYMGPFKQDPKTFNSNINENF